MPSNASSTRKTMMVPFVDDVEEKYQTANAAASAQLLSMDVKKVDHVGIFSRVGSPSTPTLPAPQAVLDALAALSPRKNEGKVKLSPVCISRFENYTMDEQPTPVAFSFNLLHDGLLSPKSIDPNFQTFSQPDHANTDVMGTAPAVGQTGPFIKTDNPAIVPER